MSTLSRTPQQRQARLTEAFLLLLVLLTLVFGVLLVSVAKNRDISDNAVLINTASAEELSRVLNVPAAFGKRLVLARTTRGGWDDVDALGRVPVVPLPREAAAKLRASGMATPAQATRAALQKTLGLDAPTLDRVVALRDVAKPASSWERVLSGPIISPARLSAAAPRLIARTWGEAHQRLLVCALLLAVFLLAVHFVLRGVCPKADPFLLPLTGMLSVLGVLLLFALKDPIRDMLSFSAQTTGIVLGGGLALLLALSRPFARAPLHRYGYLYALAAVGGTVLLGIAGSGPGGVHLSVAGAQPVEFIKILLVFFLAAYLAERGAVLDDPLKRLGPFPLPRRADALPLIVLYALPLVLFALVRDLGPVLLLFGTFLVLVYLATGRGMYVALGVAALALGGFVGYKLRLGVFETRVDMWLSPWANTHKSGDHLVLGWWGLASGGPWGSGLGLGGTRFIPRGGSDLAFAALGEEMGLLGTVVIAACFFTLVVRGLQIARRAATDFDRYLAAGLSTLLALQALVIVCGTLGLLPLAGITLPLVSYGKSSLITSFFAVGNLLAISAREPSATIAPLPAYRIAARRLGLFFAGVFGITVLRMVYVQEIAADRFAGKTVRVPDADNVARPHVNPRVLLLSNRIPRGRILDRESRVLAETKNGKRIYPYGAVTAHLVGYVNPAVGGPQGMEKELAAPLRGFDDWAGLMTLWRRKDLPGFQLPAGQDVTLSLDAPLQKAALAALKAGTASVRDKRTGRAKTRGAIVVLDVATGGVLCAVTAPTYDPNTLSPDEMQSLSTNLNGDFPLINRAVDGYYPPGSTFKIVTASALLSGENADFTYLCSHIDRNVHWTIGNTPYSRRRIVDDEGDRPHGMTDLQEAIAASCNIYFAHAGIALGPSALREAAAQYEFSRLPTLDKFGAELPDIAYGQGPMLASPMEMASVAQTVANGGKRLRPAYRLNAAGETTTPLSPANAARLAQMMRAVTLRGTAAGRFDALPYAVAGKTGTAQNDRYDKMPHSWFIGFAPADHPKIAFAVLIENGGYGASAAVPVARRVLQAANRRP